MEPDLFPYMSLKNRNLMRYNKFPLSVLYVRSITILATNSREINFLQCKSQFKFLMSFNTSWGIDTFSFHLKDYFDY